MKQLTDPKEIAEAIRRLEEIKYEMKDLVSEAKNIVHQVSGGDVRYERAKCYWIAHIEGALDKDNEWLGGSMQNMQDTIDELKDPEGEYSEEAEDDE
jgi:hypothetical protein